MKRRSFFGTLVGLVAGTAAAAVPKAKEVAIYHGVVTGRTSASAVNTSNVPKPGAIPDWFEEEKKWKGTFLISARLPGMRVYKDFVFTGRMPMIVRFSTQYIKNINTGEVMKQRTTMRHVPNAALAEHIDREWLIDRDYLPDTSMMYSRREA